MERTSVNWITPNFPRSPKQSWAASSFIMREMYSIGSDRNHFAILPVSFSLNHKNKRVVWCWFTATGMCNSGCGFTKAFTPNCSRLGNSVLWESIPKALCSVRLASSTFTPTDALRGPSKRRATSGLGIKSMANALSCRAPLAMEWAMRASRASYLRNGHFLFWNHLNRMIRNKLETDSSVNFFKFLNSCALTKNVYVSRSPKPKPEIIFIAIFGWYKHIK